MDAAVAGFLLNIMYILYKIKLCFYLLYDKIIY